MKKKVLIVNTVNTGFTGITSVIMNYVRKTYTSVQYDFVLCGKVDSGFIEALKRFGENVFQPPCSRGKKPLNYSFWLRKLIEENNYDVIHVHGNSGTMFFDIHAAKKAGVPIRITHSHSTSCKHMVAHNILRPILNRELTHAIACSDMAGKWLFTRDYAVLPNGIDVEKFAFSQAVRDEYRKKLGLEDKLVIGHIGYMDTEKNHMFLLRVFADLVKSQPDAMLLLIGDGRLRTEIESYIKELQLENYVQVLGKRGDVAQLYQCMDVFVLPSLFEGLPVTLVEAQAAGLPCVVSDTVTRQVNITNNIEYVGIQDANITDWVEQIVNSAKLTGRECWAEAIGCTIYNIDNCIKELYGIYEVEDNGGMLDEDFK